VESSCKLGNEPSGFIYRVAAQLAASQVVLNSTKLVSWLVKRKTEDNINKKKQKTMKLTVS
jgi:hypothetical protein